MLPRRLVLVLLAAIALDAGDHRLMAAPVAAGSESGAWVIAPAVQRGVLLHFIPVGSAELIAHVVATFPSEPIAMAAKGDDAILIFSAHPSDSPEVKLHPTRLIRRITSSDRPRFARPHVLAPLPALGEVSDLALVGGEPSVLLRTSDDRLMLLTLRANEWQPSDLPQGLGDPDSTWLVDVGDEPALLQQIGPGELALWTRRTDRDQAASWEARSISSPRPIDDVVALPAALTAIAHEPESLTILELRDARFAPAATLTGVREAHALVPLADSIVLFWDASRTESGLIARLVSTEGRTLYEGPVVVAGPVSPAEIQILIVLVGSVLLTAIVFVLRPELRAAAPLKFPDGASLASPSRRAVAFLVDLVPGLAIVYLVWFADVRSLEDGATVLAHRGALPIFAAAAITIALATVGEATTGRTLGKALFRCRTISYTGERPLWRQALGRNAVKVLCPPIGLFVMLAPASPHPGSFDTLVIVDHPGRPPRSDGPSGGGDGEDGSGRAEGESEAEPDPPGRFDHT